MRSAGGILIAVALAVAGMFAFWDDAVGVIPQVAEFRSIIVGMVVITIIAGVLLFLLDSASKAVESVSLLVEWNYDCRRAQATDARFIDKLSTAEIGPETSDLAAISRFISQSAPLVFVVLRNKQTSSKIREELCGYFILFPLSVQGIECLRSGTFHAPNPQDDHLCPPGRCRAVYIGGLAAESGRARPQSVQFMLGVLRSQCVQANQVYARAGSDRGLNLLEKRGFVPLHPAFSGRGHVYQRDL